MLRVFLPASRFGAVAGACNESAYACGSTRPAGL